MAEELEHSVISSLVIETVPERTEQIAAQFSHMDGVEVHGQEPGKFVITIEKETVDESHELANSFSQIDGVINTDLIYFNFEDDPDLQAKFDALHRK